MPKSARLIAEGIEFEVVIVHHALKKLLKYNEVAFVELDRNLASFYLEKKVNKRTCFFFIPGEIDPIEFEEQVYARFQLVE